MIDLQNAVQKILTRGFKALILLSLALYASSGCAVVGLTVGSVIDASQHETTIVKENFHEKKLKFKKVSIILTDGTQIEGSCEGKGQLTDSLYLNSFNDNDSSIIFSPKPGERIAIVTGFKDSLEGTFVGYDLVSKPKQKFVAGSSTYDSFSSYICRLQKDNKRGVTDVFLHRIKSINGSDSTVYNPSMIRRLASNSKLPLLTVLKVKTDAGRQLVPYPEISSLEYPAASNSKWKLMAIGAAVDIVSILIFALTWDMGSSGW